MVSMTTPGAISSLVGAMRSVWSAFVLPATAPVLRTAAWSAVDVSAAPAVARKLLRSIPLSIPTKQPPAFLSALQNSETQQPCSGPHPETEDYPRARSKAHRHNRTSAAWRRTLSTTPLHAHSRRCGRSNRDSARPYKASCPVRPCAKDLRSTSVCPSRAHEKSHRPERVPLQSGRCLARTYGWDRSCSPPKDRQSSAAAASSPGCTPQSRDASRSRPSRHGPQQTSHALSSRELPPRPTATSECRDTPEATGR